MLAAMAAGNGPALVIGTDCPALTPTHLRAAANALRDADVVLIPAEDGGYVLIGARAAHPQLFSGIAWGTHTVLPKRVRALPRSASPRSNSLRSGTSTPRATSRGFEREFPELAL